MRHPSFARTDHRPWPCPERPWAWRQTWLDLCFLHWRCEPELLRPLVPPGLEVDTFDGSAWIGVVPFRMRAVTPRRVPPLPGISAFPELNLRTYVRAGDRPGVWFDSLDITKRLPVWVARTRFHLPYFRADMRCERDGEAVSYSSRRLDRGTATFEARYEPVGAVALSRPGTLEHFLTERYCLFACSRRGRLVRGDIHHLPWPLQPARCELVRNEWRPPFAAALAGEPESCLLARRIEVVVWSVVPQDEAVDRRSERARWAEQAHPMGPRGRRPAATAADR